MYIGDIRSINNPDFANWIPLIYPQRTWDKGNYRNMVLHDITSNDTNGQPSIRRYDKGDDYNFAIINCPHLDSNIPTAPAYGVYISQLVRYARACSLYPDYWQRRRILRTKLLNQGLLKNHFILSFKTVSEDTNTLLKSILLVVYIWRKMVLAIIVWFKVDYCFTIMSYDGLVYYLISRWWLRSSALFNIYDNFCVTKIKYIMYNVQDYSVLYITDVRPVKYEG